MSTAIKPLIAGERLTRAEFHDRYEAMPPGTTFELIEGLVHMASPVGPRHGKQSFQVSGWLFQYVWQTPGVEGLDNASVAIDDRNEVQPDLLLRIEPDRGGQSQDRSHAIVGSPELVVEVADSSRPIDLGSKRQVYERGECLEYVVFALQPFDVHWHIRQIDLLVRISPDTDGLYRSTSFPGLWLDPVALQTGNVPTLLAVLARGLATPEHAAFVARLAVRG